MTLPRAFPAFFFALVTAAIFLVSGGCTTTPTSAVVSPTEVAVAPKPSIKADSSIAANDIAADEAAAEHLPLDTQPDTDDANIALKLTGAPEPVVIGDAVDSQELVVVPDDMTPPPNDLWQRIRNGFKLNHDHKRVAGDIAWFQRNQDYLNRLIDRGEPYLHMIVDEVERRGIPLEIALLPVVESAFQPFAYSHGRASGIWQFIPGTGRLYGLKQNWWYDGRRDVFAATRAALDYLQVLADEFHGDWELALAAYNSGEGTVRRAVLRNLRAKKPTDFWNLKLPAETRGYVPRLHAVAVIVDDPERYGLTLRSVPDQPYLARVPVAGQIDLAFAAYLAEISLEDIYRFNPAFNRWATDPEGPHYLLMPVAVAEVFEQRITQFPLDERLRWERRSMNEGETLAAVATAYGTTVDVLERINKIKANKVRPGLDIVIPISMHDMDEHDPNAVPVVVPVAVVEKTTEAAEPGGEKIIHEVRHGDTLYAIARKYHVNVKDIAQWNKMKSIHAPLRADQALVIWSPEEAAVEVPSVPIAVAVSAPLAGPSQEDVLRQINYVVRRGDTLSRVSERFKVTIRQIQTWNLLPKNRRLRPGQKIRLQVDIRQQ